MTFDIETLGKNIGGIAPGKHTSLYFDLNEHYLLMERMKRAEGERNNDDDHVRRDPDFEREPDGRD